MIVPKAFRWSETESADLHVDAIYQGGRKGHGGDDPLPRLLSVSGRGGFRYRGSLDNLKMIVLTSSFNDPDWPDELDGDIGVFTYYGDNKQPGLGLHETPRYGNELLRRLFDFVHLGDRTKVPPIFAFANTGEWRDVRFLGLAVPGTSEHRTSEDLVAVWRMTKGLRFQNYRALFTILDIPTIDRKWIKQVIAGKAHTADAPAAWQEWVNTGRYRPLKAERSLEYRSKAEQIPSSRTDLAIIKKIKSFFSKRPHDFERCAAEIAKFMLPDIVAMDLTRPSRDGGRDAIGQLRLGQGAGTMLVDFALEAKCYALTKSIGVRAMSRLISRLRHRQFGILVTTSYVGLQVYKEIKEDQHPIIVISASDIVTLLKSNGYSNAAAVEAWLLREFSAPSAASS